MRQVIGKLPALRQHILLSATDSEVIPSFVRMDGTRKLNYIDGTVADEGIIQFITCATYGGSAGKGEIFDVRTQGVGDAGLDGAERRRGCHSRP